MKLFKFTWEDTDFKIFLAVVACVGIGYVLGLFSAACIFFNIMNS